MKIENIINLINGELLNSPTVTEIDSATVFYSKIDNGDLFISNNIEDINRAIDRGAYAIIYDDKSIKIEDNEVAHILVDDIYEASFRFLRYVILNKDVSIRYLNMHELSFAKMIITQKSNLTILSDDWKKAFEQILNSNDRLFVGSNKKILSMIKPDTKILSKKADGYIIMDTLFKSTFKIDKFIYQEKELVPFHFDNLCRAVYFAKEYDLPYEIDRVKYTKHFTPVFIDDSMSSTSSKKSDRVLIFVDNIEDILEAKDYIKHNGKWIKSIVLTPPKTKIKNMMDNPIWFENEEEAKDIIQNNHFNYALVYSLDKSIVNSIKNEYSLF
ncbi:hypothetical protein MNB_SV-15-265 [hydrothermal vent metagenome]|uniref:Uncharacterized protein n=1 Tax=hydrothermal vent metagenome TaxID=652676 RepID=A0A1W1EHP5_9ZZZZ